MSLYTLNNQILVVQVEDQGAELTSIRNHKTGEEYLWNADPAYWKRHAPILFPVVGSLKNKCYTYQGKTYSLPQHGFARDMKFSLKSQSGHEIWFSLEDNEDTRKVYPFAFCLELGYRLEENTVTALWRVINTGDAPLYFSIGGHPAFLLQPGAYDSNAATANTAEVSDTAAHNLCYFQFDTEKPLHYLLVDESGLEIKKTFDRQEVLNTEHGIYPIHPALFDQDALVMEEHQCHQISLLNASREAYLTVTFDAPLFGLWSPAGKNAPFVCIEPWYGRCDSSDFEGTLEEREYGNRLNPGEVFDQSYRIKIH